MSKLLESFDKICDEFIDKIESINDKIIPLGENDKREIDDIEHYIRELREKLIKHA